jgi:hypothetical protein
MSAPYNPGPGENQPGQQPQWGNYPDGANYPPQSPSGYPEPTVYPGQRGYLGQGNYPAQGGYQQGNYPQQPSGYNYQQQPQQPQQPSWRSGYDQPRESAGVVGLAAVAVGALLLIIGVTALNWYTVLGQPGKLKDLGNSAKDIDAGLMKAYSGFLVWILVLAVVASAVVASMPSGAATLFRIITPVLGVLGVVITLLASSSFWSKAKDTGLQDAGVFKHTQIGFYLTLLGFLVAGIAGVFGPRRA